MRFLLGVLTPSTATVHRHTFLWVTRCFCQATKHTTVIFSTTASCGMLVLTMQNLGIIGGMTIEWPRSLEGLFNVCKFLLLDVDKFGFSCIAGSLALVHLPSFFGNINQSSKILLCLPVLTDNLRQPCTYSLPLSSVGISNVYPMAFSGLWSVPALSNLCLGRPQSLQYRRCHVADRFRHHVLYSLGSYDVLQTSQWPQKCHAVQWGHLWYFWSPSHAEHQLDSTGGFCDGLCLSLYFRGGKRCPAQNGLACRLASPKLY